MTARFLATWLLLLPAFTQAAPLGADADVGCRKDPQETARLVIDKPGTYENYLVDSQWQGGNRVKIEADDVALRDSEIRNATGNGIGVFGKNVTIERCKIHHLLNSTFDKQHGAHGITGHPQHLVVRNCEIYYVSGDTLQFDPDRNAWDDVLVENCTLWSGPLPEDAAGFKKGQRPGENAFDSKTPPAGPRCRITFRRCIFRGWNQPGQIETLAALNLKENVDATVEQCVFVDNQVAFRLRGPGSRGGALVRVADCAIYDAGVGVRMEDRLEGLKINGLMFGAKVAKRYHQVGNGPWPGYENTDERPAPPLELLLQNGFDEWRKK
jgi:hypothetical protein